jgi:NAD(P)H-flavin reductase
VAGRTGCRPATVYLAARHERDQYDLDSVHELVCRHGWLEVVLAAPADGADRESAIGRLRACLAARGSWAGHDIHLSGPPDLAPGLTDLLIGLGAEPGLIRHDPVPVTFNRTEPLSCSEWFLDKRDIAWINRTDLGQA